MSETIKINTKLSSCDETNKRVAKIFNSIEKKNIEELEGVLDRDVEEIDIKDDLLRTPLDYAISIENIDAALLLIKKGANVNSVNKNGLTPLHTLVKYLDQYWQNDIASEKVMELLKQLIISGANSDAQDRRGNTVINCLSQRAKGNKPYTSFYTQIGKLILSYDKKSSETIQIKNNMGKTPLDYSSRNGNKILRDTIFDILPQNQEKINRIIEEGERAIQKALDMSKEEEVA